MCAEYLWNRSEIYQEKTGEQRNEKKNQGRCRKVQEIKPQLEENVRRYFERRNPSRPNRVYVLVIRIHPTASLLSSGYGPSRNLQEVVGAPNSGDNPASGSGSPRQFQLGFR